MVDVINETNQIKHLPYGNVSLQPGENEVAEEKIEQNKGHKGFEYDLKNGNIKIKSEKEDEKEEIGDEGNIDNEFPKKSGGSWYLVSTGEKIQGEDKAIEIQKKIDNGEL